MEKNCWTCKHSIIDEKTDSIFCQHPKLVNQMLKKSSYKDLSSNMLKCYVDVEKERRKIFFGLCGKKGKLYEREDYLKW